MKYVNLIKILTLSLLITLTMQTEAMEEVAFEATANSQELVVKLNF
jgi:hypothetical protein